MQIDDIDMSRLTTSETVIRVDRNADEITLQNISKTFINSKDIDKIFVDTYDLIPVPTRSDPIQYLPEINDAFIQLNNTILALKPFASTLNDIFSNFDCKFTSFTSGSQSFRKIRKYVMDLHSSLISLSPTKVNSLVFLIVSRFIALLSSFLSAISAMVYDTNNEQEKAFVFSLQQENERLNNLVEKNKLAC